MQYERRLLLGILCTAPLWLQAAPARRNLHLSNQEYPPYMGESLPAGGILSAVVSEIFSRLNIDIGYEWFPNNRTLQLARTGHVDGSLGWTPTADRLKDLLFSDEILPFRMVLMHRAGESYAWKTLADLAPYRFGTTVGNFYSDTFSSLHGKGLLKVDSASDDVTNLRKLIARRIDLFPIEAETGLLLLRTNLPARDIDKLVIQDRPYWSTPLCMVLSRKMPQAPALMAAFNRELARMKANGELARLIRQTREQVLIKLSLP